MKVLINTQSNFRNLNEKILTVKEHVGRRVTCPVFLEEHQSEVDVDFTIDEVTFIKSIELSTSNFSYRELLLKLKEVTLETKDRYLINLFYAIKENSISNDQADDLIYKYEKHINEIN